MCVCVCVAHRSSRFGPPSSPSCPHAGRLRKRGPFGSAKHGVASLSDTLAFLLNLLCVARMLSYCPTPLAEVHEPVTHPNAPFSDLSNVFFSTGSLGRTWMGLCWRVQAPAVAQGLSVLA